MSKESEAVKDLRDVTNREVDRFVNIALDERQPTAIGGKLFNSCPRCGCAKAKNRKCDFCGYKE